VFSRINVSNIMGWKLVRHWMLLEETTS